MRFPLPPYQSSFKVKESVYVKTFNEWYVIGYKFEKI